MKPFKIKSLDPTVTNEQLEQNGCNTVSFLSFERAIRESNQLAGITDIVKGYEVNNEGIKIIWG